MVEPGTLTERVVGSVLDKPGPELPDEVLRAAVDRILDTVGVGIAGSQTPAAEAVTRAALADSGRHGVPVWGRGIRAPARIAVLINGAAAHALDFDDSLFGSIMHAGALVVPVALAVAEEVGATGHDLLAAVACGYQLADVLGRQAPGTFQAGGFQPSSVLGVFAGVVVAARLRGLDTGTALDAAGLAGSMAGGLMEFIDGGGDGKPLQLGWAAQSALYAVDLATAGARGPRTVLEGRYGIFRSFARTSLPDDIDVWSDHAILRVATKPYPVCHGIHDPADLWQETSRELRDRGLDPISDVTRVTCLVSEFTARLTLDPLAVKRRPSSPHQARFSLPYCLARIAIDDHLGTRSFDPGSLHDPIAAGFMDKVHFEVTHPGAPARVARTGLRVHLGSGEVVERFLERRRDAREELCGADDLRRKFLENVADHTVPGAAERAVDAAAAMYAENDASDFLDWLGSCSPSSADPSPPRCEGATGE
jgi:2-methylcitrate dehydratase PrpD